MSTAHVSRRDVPYPKKDGMLAQKRRARAHRTKISQIYRGPGDEQLPEQPKNTPRLDALDKTVMSLELLNQYNDIIGQEDSLAYRKLPPVKLSYQPVNKFMESPRGDLSSRIIRPHLTMKTYSPGHHIFTEGISRNSEMPSPTFALQRVGVPYSNLPDNIAVYKEKDKFAFTVNREEYDKSPYRLTPKPFHIGHGQVITHIIPSQYTDATEKSDESPKVAGKRRSDRSSISLKSNIIKLEPLVGYEGSEPVTQEHLTSSHTVSVSDKRSKSSQKTTESSKPSGERKLSIISVGDSVGLDFYSRCQREARQEYPMYDHRSRKAEQYRREKYGLGYGQRSKPKVPTSTFTYKVSTRDHSFVQESSQDRFRPIKNNLRDKYGNPINKQRGIGRYSDNSDSNNGDKKSTDYNFRRYYSRSFHLPNSAGTNSSDMTHLPGNPPPSEISHIISEEGLTLPVNDLRNEMVTLHEERTMTASIMSFKGAEEGQRKLMQSVAETPGAPIDDRATARTNVTHTTTDTEIQFQTAERLTEQARKSAISATDKKDENNRSQVYKADATYRIREESEKEIDASDNTETDSKTDTVKQTTNTSEAGENEKDHTDKNERKGAEEKETVLHQQSGTGKGDDQTESVTEQKADTLIPKQYLPVPKLSLDDTCKLELPLIAERTSLSRTIQSLPVNDTKPVNQLCGEINDNSETNKNKKNERVVLAPLPITRLHLFSESSSTSNLAPSINITDENGDEQELSTISEDPDKMNPDVFPPLSSEKRLVCNSNVQFIYPATNEIKAKRQ